MFKQNLGRGDMTRIALYMHVTLYLNYGLSFFFFLFFFFTVKNFGCEFPVVFKAVIKKNFVRLFICLLVCLFVCFYNVTHSYVLA